MFLVALVGPEAALRLAAGGLLLAGELVKVVDDGIDVTVYGRHGGWRKDASPEAQVAARRGLGVGVGVVG